MTNPVGSINKASCNGFVTQEQRIAESAKNTVNTLTLKFMNHWLFMKLGNCAAVPQKSEKELATHWVNLTVENFEKERGRLCRTDEYV